MSYPVYYVPAGDVLPVMFASYAGSTGASATLTGLTVTDIEIYKDGSTTQRASDAGYTLLDTDGIDFDSTTGIHGFSIDTGDNTDSGFYTVGSWFHVVVASVTVDSQTVNFIACAFRIMPAESSAGVPKVDVSHYGGTAGTFSGGRPEVNATHFAGTAYATALAAEVDAVWDEATSGHTTAGTTGKAVIDILDDTGTSGVVVAAGSKTGYSLSATQTFDLTGNITGNLSGSVGSLTTNNDKTGYALSATGSAAMTEGYAALGAAATLPQLLYEVRALLAEKSISGTTLTTKKLDGTTTAATYTLDDATTPSAITRAT